MYPTLSEVLDLPVLRAAAPRTRAGSAQLGARVRWVHVSEQRDPTGTLTGGELVLSTGIALADPATDLQAYVARLHDAGAVGLVVELGEPVPALPDGLVQAARALDLPLVELRRSVRFVEITEVVHARILDEQATRMRFTQRVHDSFRTLAVEDGRTARVLAEAAALSGQPVVLEDLGHRALSTAAADLVPAAALLEDWPARSRQVPMTASTTTAGPEGWTTTPVGPRARAWGRLVVPRRVVGADAQDTVRLVLEQAAHALTVRRLLSDDPVAPEVEAQEDLLRDVVGGSRLDEHSLRARARALGLPRGGVLAAVVVGGPGVGDSGTVDSIAAAARRAGVPAVVGRLASGRVGLVLSCPSPEAEPVTVDRVAADLLSGPGFVVGAAGPVPAFADLPDALAEAASVVEVAAWLERGGSGRVRRRTDLGVRGLLWDLRRDGRLAAFVDAELGPVLALPEPARGSTARTLLAYLDAGGRMTAFAQAAGLSRQAAYARVERLRALLGPRMADPRARLSLHLAVLALDLAGGDGPGTESAV